MYCRNQQYQPWAIPRTEYVLDAEMPLLQEAQAADPIAAIFDRLMTVVSKLETRLDDTDRFVGEFRPPVQPQPDPDPPTLQPEMPERRWQPYQPLTHASVTSQWYPPSPTNPPQQVQTRRPTSWDPPGYRQQSGFMPYNQQPPRYHHQDENQLSYGYGPAPAYQQEPYRQPHQSTCGDLPRQQFQNAYDQLALFQQHDLQHSNCVGPSSTTYQQPQHSKLGHPTCPDRPNWRQPLGLQQYDQPQAHRVSCWEPSLTATVATHQPHQHYQHPPTDCPLQWSSPAPPVTAPVLAFPSHPQAVVPCLMTNEWETNQHGGEQRMEIQGLVDKHKEAVETIKQDMEEEIDGRRQLLEDGLRLNIEEVVMKGGASLYAFVGDEDACAIPKCLKEFPFSYSDWHACDVVSMNHRSTSLDADTRLIPPRNDTLYLAICGCKDKIHVLALNYHNSKDLPLVSFDVAAEGRRSTSRCVFDPGGDSSLTLLFATLLVLSWFPP